MQCRRTLNHYHVDPHRDVSRGVCGGAALLPIDPEGGKSAKFGPVPPTLAELENDARYCYDICCVIE